MRRTGPPPLVRAWVTIERDGRERDVLVEGVLTGESGAELEGVLDEDGGEVQLSREEEIRAIGALWDAAREGQPWDSDGD